MKAAISDALMAELDAALDAGRARDQERPRATGELGVQDEERHATEMIAVEVAQQHRAYLARVHAITVHGDQRRGAAIDQHGPLGAREVHAGLKAPAAPESIARAQEAQRDGCRHLPRCPARKARTCFSASSCARGL